MTTIEEQYTEEVFDVEVPTLQESKADPMKKASRERFKKIKGRSWFMVAQEGCWTDYLNYERLHELLNGTYDKMNNINYMCHNEEVSDGGAKHMHIYMELQTPISQLTLMNLLPGVHVAKRMGNPSEARRYIEKPEGVEFSGKEKSHTVVKPIVEYGDWDKYKNVKARGRGGQTGDKMSANQRIDEMLENCSTEVECMNYDPAFYNQFRNTIVPLLGEKLKREFKANHCVVRKSAEGYESVQVKLRVAFLTGGPGVGKTTGVYDKYGYENVYRSTFKENSNGQFFLEFEGYKGEPVVLVDEVSSDRFPSIDYMKEFLDVSNTSDLPARYNNKARLFHTIIFVSNYEFDSLYTLLRISKNHTDSYRAFVRRFNMGVWKMDTVGSDNRRVVVDCTPREFLGRLNLALLKPESPVTSSAEVITEEKYDEMREDAVVFSGDGCPF